MSRPMMMLLLFALLVVGLMFFLRSQVSEQEVKTVEANVTANVE